MDYGFRGDGMLGKNMPAIGWIQIESPPPPSNRIYVVLQSTLEERLNLRLHRKTRQSTVYALVLGAAAWRWNHRRTRPFGSETCPTVRPTELVPGHFHGEAISMTMLVNLLAGPPASRREQNRPHRPLRHRPALRSRRRAIAGRRGRSVSFHSSPETVRTQARIGKRPRRIPRHRSHRETEHQLVCRRNRIN